MNYLPGPCSCRAEDEATQWIEIPEEDHAVAASKEVFSLVVEYHKDSVLKDRVY
jgi:hypothetical protein